MTYPPPCEEVIYDEEDQEEKNQLSGQIFDVGYESPEEQSSQDS